MKSKNAPARAGFVAVHLLPKLPIALAAMISMVTLCPPVEAYDRLISPQIPWSNGFPSPLPGPGNCHGQRPPDSDWKNQDPAALVQLFVDFYNANCSIVSDCETQHTATDSVVGPIGYGGQPEPGLYDFGRYTARNIVHVSAKNCSDGRKDRDVDWYIDLFKSCQSGGNDQAYGPSSEKCVCETPYAWVPQGEDGNCVSVKDAQRDEPKACPRFGNPIYPLTGAKRQQVEIDVGLSIPLRLTYDTRSMLPGKGDAIISPVAPLSFGPLWGSSFHKQIGRQGSGSPDRVVALRGDGVSETFISNAGKYVAHSGSDSILVNFGYNIKYRYTDRSGLLLEQFNNDGSLPEVKIESAQGGALTYVYSAGPIAGVAPVKGLLIGVTDKFGRSVKLNYEQPDGQVLRPRIYRVLDIADRPIDFGYDQAGNLKTIKWPDSKVREFVYERLDLPWAMTGIIDEEGQRHSTYGYDGQGRAASTEYGVGIEKYSSRWSSPPSWQITDVYDAGVHVIWREHAWTKPLGVEVKGPLGTWATLGSQVVNGMPRQTSRDQPGGSGCGASSSEQTQDSRGNVLSRLDFGEAGVNRHRTCFAYASDRNIETYRVEGLMESDGCPADLATYKISAELPADKPQRKITTEWHPVWNREVRRAEPKLIATTIYNGEKDPPLTGTPLYCVDGDPKLQDNATRFALACKRYEQSTKDETGNAGFAAEVSETRGWSYQYNQDGQLRLETDPRGKQTKYEYYPETLFEGDGEAARGHWKGDLQRVTNALNQATNYLEYNKRGQPLTIKYANGSQELREYHVRGWLSKATQVPADSKPSQATRYDYHDTGLLKQVTQPDGSFAMYDWDKAHRLIGVSDSLGNTVTYDLDDAGNRKKETFADKSGVLAKTISRTFDALGRMSSTTGLQ